jgi:hypothetical protein
MFWILNFLALFSLAGGSIWCNAIAIQDEPKILVSLFLFFIPAGLVLLFFANLYPEIKTDDRGLLVKFFLRWLRVKWDEVESVTPGLFFDDIVIRTRALTGFHSLYGLLGLSLVPSFVVKPRISHYRKLMALIEMKLNTP